MMREAMVAALGDGLFSCRERIDLHDPRGMAAPRRLEDEFTIRAWSRDDLFSAAGCAGRSVEADALHRIPGCGACSIVLPRDR